MGKNTQRSSLVSSRRGIMKGNKRAKDPSVKSMPKKVSPVRSISDDDYDSGLGFDASVSTEISQSVPQNTTTYQFPIIPKITTSTPNAAPIPLVNCIPQVISMSGTADHVVKKLRVEVDTISEDAQEPVETKGYTTLHLSPAVLTFKNAIHGTNPSIIHTNPSTGVSWNNIPIQSISAKPRTKSISKYSSSSQEPLSSRSSCGNYQLVLLSQPESQHRARYKTEGSRGAVKDRDGQSFPTVKLEGYKQATTLEVFVAKDCDPVTPHLFYQACKVTGKNSTSCKERRRQDRTVFIDIQITPDNDMTVSCDCVGILKERNADIEKHRGKSAISRGKKRSTKCRLVFRTVVTLASGRQETLQVVSQPISCSQPLGVPEISLTSLSECLATGGENLIILGKNFHKDPVVIFRELEAEDESKPSWIVKVSPDKDNLQPVHLVCKVPPYKLQNISENVEVQVLVMSSDKLSEPHKFLYKPLPLKSETVVEQSEPKLPKGVSPDAVKLNQLYATTGAVPSLDETIQMDSKDISITDQFLFTEKDADYLKEEKIHSLELYLKDLQPSSQNSFVSNGNSSKKKSNNDITILPMNSDAVITKPQQYIISPSVQMEIKLDQTIISNTTSIPIVTSTTTNCFNNRNLKTQQYQPLVTTSQHLIDGTMPTDLFTTQSYIIDESQGISNASFSKATNSSSFLTGSQSNPTYSSLQNIKLGNEKEVRNFHENINVNQKTNLINSVLTPIDPNSMMITPEFGVDHKGVQLVPTVSQLMPTLSMDSIKMSKPVTSIENMLLLPQEIQNETPMPTTVTPVSSLKNYETKQPIISSTVSDPLLSQSVNLNPSDNIPTNNILISDRDCNMFAANSLVGMDNIGQTSASEQTNCTNIKLATNNEINNDMNGLDYTSFLTYLNNV